LSGRSDFAAGASLALLLVMVCPAFAIERHDPSPGLAKVRRIYVDQLGGGRTSDQMRDMLITALENSGLFVVTENPERADASLRGSSDDAVFTDEHHTTDSIGIHTTEGSGSSAGANLGTNSSSHQNSGIGVTDNESTHTLERRHESTASVRLVGADGDVIWSTTQESTGAKFRGAMADVADKIARRLIDETKRSRCAVDPGCAKVP
jgi:hypothetical protein